MTPAASITTPPRRRLGRTELQVHPLCLGTNAFGWTADEAASFAVLDSYVEAGGNFLDTSDVYSVWVPGHEGGESERVIGSWLRASGRRDEIVLSTKVGAMGGLSRGNVRRCAEACLRRLGVDRIDVLYAHLDDPETPLEETLSEFAALVAEGKAGHLAASNYTPERLAEAIAVARREGFPEFLVFSGHYNLLERRKLTGTPPGRTPVGAYEDAFKSLCEREDIAFIPYWVLAKGFLTGKYRPSETVAVEAFSARAAQHRPADYLDARSTAVLAALDEIAAAHDATPAAVALAWTAAQSMVASVLGGARTPEQLSELMAMASLTLSPAELDRLTTVSEERAT